MTVVTLVTVVWVYSDSSVTPVTSVTLFEIQYPRLACSCRLEIDPRRVQNFVVVMHNGFRRRNGRGLFISKRGEKLGRRTRPSQIINNEGNSFVFRQAFSEYSGLQTDDRSAEKRLLSRACCSFLCEV